MVVEVWDFTEGHTVFIFMVEVMIRHCFALKSKSILSVASIMFLCLTTGICNIERFLI